MIKEETGAMIPNIEENVPEELAERRQWVCWCLEERDEKLTKVPYKPETARRASSTDPMTWDTFERALAAYRASEPPYDGIGFVFSDDDPFCGIDLDKCRNPHTGEVASWAREILKRVCDGYVETSPSGTGIHIIVEAVVRGGGTRRGPVEMYSRGRFFTITGEVLL